MIRPDTTKLAALQDSFLAAAHDDSLWKQASDGARDVVGGSKGLISIVDVQTGRRNHLHGDCDPDFAALCCDPKVHNPFVPHLLKPGRHFLATDQHLMPRNEFRRTTFFNRWLSPQADHGIIILKAPVGEGIFAWLGYTCGRDREFDAPQVEFIRELIPSISRAARLRLALERLRLGVQAQHLGMHRTCHVLVDSTMRHLQMNDAAEALFSDRGCGMALHAGKLSISDATADNVLRSFVVKACAQNLYSNRVGGELLVRSPQTGTPVLALMVAPYLGPVAVDLRVARAAIVIIQDLRQKAPSGLQLYHSDMLGLTTREAALAEALCEGAALADYAESRSIGLATVRTQLKRLFEKTGTTRQGQLVAFLNRISRLPH